MAEKMNGILLLFVKEDAIVKRNMTLAGLGLCVLIMLTGCSSTHALTTEQIGEVNAAFEPLLPAGDGDIIGMSGPDGEFTLNPITHFFTSYYDTPEQMDMGSFVYYMPRESFLRSSEDGAELATLKAAYPQLDIENILRNVPFGRIPFATVNQCLQTYMNVTLGDMTNMGTALYLDEYKTFYSSASDFGPGFFVCTGGEIEGDTVILDSDHAVLTLKKDGENYFIISHIAKS